MIGYTPRPRSRLGSTNACPTASWLITFTADHEGRSEAHVIDARDVTAPPLARVKLPRRVPIGFHGVWAPGV